MIFNKTIVTCGLLFASSVNAFAPTASTLNFRAERVPSLNAHESTNNEARNLGENAARVVCTLLLSSGIVGTIIFPGVAFASEIGVEVEAPTLYTGETVEVRCRS